MLFAAAGMRARFIFLQKDWFAQIDADVSSLVRDTLGTTADTSELAWVRFRDREFGITGATSPDFRKADISGPYTHLAGIVGSATPTQICNPSVRATAQAYNSSSPKPCAATALSTPNAPESRNNLQYAANQSVGIDVDGTWQYTSGDFDVLVTYLDSGTDTFNVAWQTAGGTQTQTVTKTNTQTWQTATVALGAALFNGALP